MKQKSTFNKYGEDLKVITFAITDKQHVDLRIRIHHDGLSQVKFFQAILQGYLNRDELLVGYIEKYKEQNNIHSRQKRKRALKLTEKGEEKLMEFNLSEKEKQNIFDIIGADYDEEM